MLKKTQMYFMIELYNCQDKNYSIFFNTAKQLQKPVYKFFLNNKVGAYFAFYQVHQTGF